ncbi:putative Ig domain-containing protein [Janthinobacterium lividum]|uniref:S53 family peptidase n=1 Tax=Janthinobacterium lividum TaxID=29581 RepID=UPI0008739B42|nr:S53 family peptidase [Janthinobacterium lividum]MCC7712421.1 S53 family peptidase [Janthinobacterium lividum]OEZ62371.1 pseudomonalisin precursor [Janthinobacterium lividum]WQE26908.1 S53 family peptidase [Janthinobacterium lividum]STQ97793.1 Pseudomonalisin precursor [Janthinobacterium lividum]
MKKNIPPHHRHGRLLLGATAALLLAACGPGQETSTPPAAIATAATQFTVEVPVIPPAVGALVVQPMFHAAPALLDAPDGRDSANSSGSAHWRPHLQNVPGAMREMTTRRLTAQKIAASEQAAQDIAPLLDGGASDIAAPMAGSSVVATYSPAQIRAAYDLPALPAAGTALTPAQAAQLGAGQTIYIVDAMHNPNAAAELAIFNQKFGLPGCTTKAIATNATLPLPPAPASGCEFSVVYNTPSSTMTATAPAYNSGWAMEIALDVQWAHATAPLARIVLIEAPDASINSLLGAVRLANQMGPGVVSMSFGAAEGNWTASVDSAFTGKNMSYLAATGDSGSGVSWPSVSSNVLAVGGTTLSYSGSGVRSETAWSGTGGGISAYTALPTYQTASVPGLTNLLRRNVADVAFNADPATGQYTAVMTPGSSTASWLSIGGTSLSTPQWAGLVAITNASRALQAKTALGLPHSILYGQIASVPGTFASSFADITRGSNGTCSVCTARVGYDPLGGLGTPNVKSLLAGLSGMQTAPAAPVVAPASISGAAGKPLSFTVSASASNPLSYTMLGAPAGMSIAATGVVSWAAPTAGTYAVTMVAKDTVSGLSGQGVYAIVITPVAPPVVGAGAITGKVGTALAFNVSVSAPNPVSYTLGGAPAGMTISSAGLVSWAAPTAGTYAVTVTATDGKTGLSGKGIYTVAIAAPLPPVVTVASVSGKPGVALSFAATTVAPNPVTYSLSGAPSGMAVSAAGVVSWASPVLGSYSVAIIAKDTRTGLTGQAVAAVKIAAAGPTISAAAMTGVAGKAMSGSIVLTAPGANALWISILGAPLGMQFSMSGMTITARWPLPVTGSYALRVVALDSNGLTAQLNVPITVTAR